MQRYIEMAPDLESDWVSLARQLGVGDRDVLRIQLDHVNVVEQAAAALRLWARAAVTRSNGSELEAALRHIGRLDIVDRFFGDAAAPSVEHGQFYCCNFYFSFNFQVILFFICPIAIAYSYGTDNKIGLRLSVCLSVCHHSHGRISLSIFTKFDTGVNPQK